MKKALMICLFAGFVALLPQNQAEAFSFDLDATLGSSHTFQVGRGSAPGPFSNFGANIEVTPSLRFLLVSADLGLHYDFLQNGLTLRPGARLHLGWFYLRAALPLAFSMRNDITEKFNLGVLVGAGVRIRVGKWAFVAEGNVTPFLLHIDSQGFSMPAELRLGLAYHF